MSGGLNVPAARGTSKAIEQDIYRLFDLMEDHAAERAERARGVLMLTAVGTDNILASSNIGGPEVSM